MNMCNSATDVSVEADQPVKIEHNAHARGWRDRLSACRRADRDKVVRHAGNLCASAADRCRNRIRRALPDGFAVDVHCMSSAGEFSELPSTVWIAYIKHNFEVVASVKNAASVEDLERLAIAASEDQVVVPLLRSLQDPLFRFAESGAK